MSRVIVEQDPLSRQQLSHRVAGLPALALGSDGFRDTSAGTEVHLGCPGAVRSPPAGAAP